jgi:hypothetical protein
MLESYKLRMAALGSHEGEFRRRNSQKIMDASWMRDASTKPVYVKWVNNGLPVVDDDDIPVYAKFNVKSYHNITGDSVAYLLQFRLEDMKANKNIRVGAYVQIMNEMDEPEWWLIVHLDDRTQFRQFSILKCTWTYKWVSMIGGKRVIYQCLGAPRKQNSYNSGVWLDYTTQTVENQEVLWLPTNDDTKTILYDTKFLKSSTGRYPPLKWTITKIEDTATDGISKFTLAQTQFDPAKDNAELMVADYYQSYIEPEITEIEETPTFSDLEIVYSGKPVVRAGGGYKKLTLKSRVDDKLVDVVEDVKWDVNFTDGDLSKLECSMADNIFKVKCINDYSLIGKTFTVTATSKHSSTSLIVEVISL